VGVWDGGGEELEELGYFQGQFTGAAGEGRREVEMSAGPAGGRGEMSDTPRKAVGLMSGAASKAVTRLWCVLVAPNLPVSCRSATARLWWGQSPTE